MPTFDELKAAVENEAEAICEKGTGVEVKSIGVNSLMLVCPAKLRRMRLDFLANGNFIREFNGQRRELSLSQPLAAAVVDDIFIPLLQ